MKALARRRWLGLCAIKRAEWELQGRRCYEHCHPGCSVFLDDAMDFQHTLCGWCQHSGQETEYDEYYPVSTYLVCRHPLPSLSDSGHNLTDDVLFVAQDCWGFRNKLPWQQATTFAPALAELAYDDYLRHLEASRQAWYREHRDDPVWGRLCEESHAAT